MSRVSKGFLWSSLDRFSVQGVSFLLSIIIARIISPESYGLIVMVQVFMSIFQTLHSTLSAYTVGMKAAAGATMAQAAAESFKTECASKSFIVNN